MVEHMVTHEDLNDRLVKGDARFCIIETKLDDLIGIVTKLTETVEPIRNDISTIKEITGGWKALGTLGQFAKWAGGIAAALGAIWIVMKAATKALIL